MMLFDINKSNEVIRTKKYQANLACKNNISKINKKVISEKGVR
jgi:hypothetical protein